MGRQLANVLIESMMLMQTSSLIQPLSLLESYTLCSLFVIVLVMTQGFLYQSLMSIDFPESRLTMESKMAIGPTESTSSLLHLCCYHSLQILCRGSRLEAWDKLFVEGLYSPGDRSERSNFQKLHLLRQGR